MFFSEGACLHGLAHESPMYCPDSAISRRELAQVTDPTHSSSAMSQQPPKPARAPQLCATLNPRTIVRDVIVIGASAGGHAAVVEILSRLPADLPAFIGVVIHRGAVSNANWSVSLGYKTTLKVVEPANGDLLSRGVVYIAPSDCHMTFANDRVSLDHGAKEHFTRPAVDPLFISAARAYGERVVAVVLTGGGHDGMQGLLHVTSAGGLSLVQKPSEAEHTSMPEYAIAHDHVRAALSVDEIGDALALLALGREVSVETTEQLDQRRAPSTRA